MFILESSWGVCFWSLWGRRTDLSTWMDSSKEEADSADSSLAFASQLMFTKHLQDIYKIYIKEYSVLNLYTVQPNVYNNPIIKV